MNAESGDGHTASARPGAQGDALEGGWRLNGVDGSGKRIILVLGETRLRRAYPGLAIGRHHALCDLVLGHPTVSLRHFRVAISGDRLTVEDLNSLNGTALDQRYLDPFAPEIMRPGAELVVGEVVFTLERLS